MKVGDKIKIIRFGNRQHNGCISTFNDELKKNVGKITTITKVYEMSKGTPITDTHYKTDISVTYGQHTSNAWYTGDEIRPLTLWERLTDKLFKE